MTLNRKLNRKVVQLCASLSLAGCTLSMPEDGKLFSPGRESDENMSDSGDAGSEPGDGRDGTQTGDGAEGGDGDPSLDGGQEPGDDAGDGPLPGDDAGSQADPDAGPSIFDPEAGLVLHYRFNETSGNTVHDFAGDNDALVVGTPSEYPQWVAAGRIDGALSLKGGVPADGETGHYVELPQGTLLGLDEATISLWVNRSGGPMWQRVFDFGSGQPVWLFFTPYGGTGLPVVAGRTPALIFVDFVPITGAPAGEGELNINKPIPASTWVHFVLTWSGSAVKVYMDGVKVAETVTHGGVTPSDLGNTGQNYLGRSQFSTDPYFQGLLDEFRIYDHVLSDSDVAQLHEVQ